jgi:glycosyltransferase involved in cell wall biosynthesis
MIEPTKIVCIDDFEPLIGAEAAERIVRLVKDKELNRTMGERARETVRKNFLLSGAVERYLDLFNSFETSYHIARKK